MFVVGTAFAAVAITIFVLFAYQAGFFDQFVGLKAKDAPFASGDEAREALRIAEDEQAPYGVAKGKRAGKKRR